MGRLRNHIKIAKWLYNVENIDIRKDNDKICRE